MSTSTLAGVTDTVTDTVTDAWSKNAGVVHDLATTAAGFASEVAVAAVAQLEDLPERVVGLAVAAKDRIHPAPRRSMKPWVLVAAAVAGFVVVAWYLRRRSSGPVAVDIGPDGRPNPVRTDHASSVAGT